MEIYKSFLIQKKYNNKRQLPWHIATGNSWNGKEDAGIMNKNRQNIIIYNTIDGKASVSLYAKDGMVWMNQNQLAELFDTSKQNIGQHINNIFEENELDENSVVKNYFTTAADGKQYNVGYSCVNLPPIPEIKCRPFLFYPATHSWDNLPLLMGFQE